MNIDPSSPIPLHHQVELLIREWLKEKRYLEGELLPPEAQIAEENSISRNTVRAAITRLVQEGLLERKAGLGTRYVKQAIKTNLSGWPSFSQEMKTKGIDVEVFSLSSELKEPDEEVVKSLRLKQHEIDGKITKMSRVRGYGGIPSVYSVSWFHPRAKLAMGENFSQPLYDLIRERSGLSVAFSKEEIIAVKADAKLSELLCCEEGDPVLLRKRVVTTTNKKEIEFNMNWYRADRFTYGLTIQAS